MFYESRVQIPLPRFVVFYNGAKVAPDDYLIKPLLVANKAEGARGPGDLGFARTETECRRR